MKEEGLYRHASEEALQSEARNTRAVRGAGTDDTANKPMWELQAKAKRNKACVPINRWQEY